MHDTVEMRNSADNSDVVVKDAIFVDCVAEGVCFDGAQLKRVRFENCEMYWATFFLAELTDVTFEKCDLRGSDFKRVKFSNCQFIQCDVGMDALGGETQFDDSDLSNVTFIECRGR